MMVGWKQCVGLLVVGLAGWGTVAAAAEPAAEVDYLRDIKPLLLKHCYKCHSSARSEGNLRLDSQAFILQGGDRGAAIVAGKSADSLLLSAVRGSDDLKMPPQGAKLTNDEIAKLQKWIDAGAAGPPDGNESRSEHWAFRPPQRPAIPESPQPSISLSPTDTFIAAEQQRRGLVPVAVAPKHVLLRRLYVDLIGLPPTPEQVAEFLADEAPDAYERTVDKLLADPAYGERWGRHWMDVWRYSDWDGFGAEVRESQPHIWRWRDWIIESLNADQSYAQMVQEMLAGDELSPEDPNVTRATGFLVRNWYKFNRHQWLDTTVEHTGKAFLGVTFNCCRCHDHMYDPLSQREYYQLRAIFEPYDVRTERVPGEVDPTKNGLVRVYDANPTVPTFLFVRGNDKNPDKENPLSAAIPKLFQTELKVAPVAFAPSAYFQGGQPFVLRDLQMAAVAAKEKATANLRTAEQQLTAAKEKLAAGPANDAGLTATVSVAEWQMQVAAAQVAAEEATVAALQARAAADAVAFAQPTPADFSTLAKHAAQSERQLKFAQSYAKVLETEWAAIRTTQELKPGDAKLEKAAKDAETAFLTALTAHETALRATEQPAAENYTKLTPVYPASSTGRRLAFARWVGSADNPLAARVAVNHIWLRHFGSPLVPTMFDFGHNGKPPTNGPLLDWLASELVAANWSMKHLHRQLVTSRTYRLHSTAGADTSANNVRDPDNLYYWRANTRRLEAEVVRDAVLHAAHSLDFRRGGPDLDPNQGTANPRRSVYFRNTKEKRMLFLSLFDSPSVVECYRRSESIVPQQALALANSDLALAQSRLLAKQLLAGRTLASEADQSAAVAAAFDVLLNRSTTADEAHVCREFLRQQAAQFTAPTKLQAFTGSAVAAVAPAADPLTRAYENLIHVLLNHNDFVTLR